MIESIVAIDALRHVFRGARGALSQVALDGLSATIRPGMITGLVGPDGAGKTTLLRLIAGLLRPTVGRITVLGHDMATDAASAHPSIGYMPQRFGLYEDLSVAENLDLFADLHAMSPAVRTERVLRLLRFTGLGPFTERLAGQLSGGMKQKLGLACALLSRPRLLLLDEPSVGVDPSSRRELWAIVSAMLEEGRANGMAVVWATTYLDEAARCGEVLLLHEGRLLAQGPPAEFLASLGGRVFRLGVPTGERRAVARRAAANPAVLDVVVTGDALRVVLREGCAVPAAQELGGETLDPLPPRFEDGFIALLAPPPRLPSPSPRGRGEGAQPPNKVPSPSPTSSAASAPSPQWITSVSPSDAARSSACWVRTAPASPLSSACCAACFVPPRARRRSQARTFCEHLRKRALASATWHSVFRCTRNSPCWRTSASSRASTASAAQRRRTPSTPP
jgi:ABC-2 type transport system ATP-binding protein